MEKKLKEAAELIRQGYTSGEEGNFWTLDIPNTTTKEDLEKIASMVEQGMEIGFEPVSWYFAPDIEDLFEREII